MAPDPRAIGRASLAGVHLPLVRHQPRGRATLRDGLALVAFELPWPGLNRVIVTDPTIAPERVRAAAEEFFAGSRHPYHVRVDDDAAHPVEAELRARGWQIRQAMPVMVLPRIPEQSPPTPAGLAIRRVMDAAGLRDYLAPKEPDAPPSEWDGIDAALHPSPAVAHDPAIALFVGYADGRPVATAALYRVGAIAEIGAVATAWAYRRRGFGTAMTWAAIAEGARRGCTAAALAATEMGYPVYRAMGFIPVYRYRSYASSVGT
jgi:GNAT superfamily N-acetyltransferase